MSCVTSRVNFVPALRRAADKDCATRSYSARASCALRAAASTVEACDSSAFQFGAQRARAGQGTLQRAARCLRANSSIVATRRSTHFVPLGVDIQRIEVVS